ncbi:MAG: hypothetical protein ACYC69_08160 [Thermodesulfovibrionales bacterium]
MKKILLYSGVLSLIVLLVVPEESFGGVRIILKNESEMVAEECQDQGDRFTCFTMGGSFELLKKDIASIKNVTLRSQELSDPGPQDKKMQSPEGKTNGKGAVPGKNDAGKAEGAASLQKNDPAAQKAAEFQAERERLRKEKQQVQEEIRNAPAWMPASQFDALSRRSAEFDQKIRKFNEEVTRALEEEKKRQAEPAK